MAAALSYYDGWIIPKVLRIYISPVFRSKWYAAQTSQRGMYRKMHGDYMYQQNMNHFGHEQRQGQYQHNKYVSSAPAAHHQYNRLPSWQARAPDAALEPHLHTLPVGIANQFAIAPHHQPMYEPPGEETLAQSKPPSEETIPIQPRQCTSLPEPLSAPPQTRVSLPAARTTSKKKNPEPPQPASDQSSRPTSQDQQQPRPAKKTAENKLPKKVSAPPKPTAPPATLPEKPTFALPNRPRAQDTNTQTATAGPAPKEKRQPPSDLPTIAERDSKAPAKATKLPTQDARQLEQPARPQAAPNPVFKSAMGDPSTEPFVYKGNRVGISTIGKKSGKKHKRPEIPSFPPRDLDRRGG